MNFSPPPPYNPVSVFLLEGRSAREMVHALNMRRAVLAVAAFVVASAGGCCLPGICRVPSPLPRERLVEELRRRAESFVTVTDTHITLRMAFRTEDGMKKLPTLGGFLVFDSRRPGLRIRAEKMGQKVFGLRAGAHRFWLEIPETREVLTGGDKGYAKLPQLIRPCEMMFWFCPPEWLGLSWDSTRMALEPEHYRFDVFSDGLLMRSVFVDRRRPAVSRILEYDLLGRVSTEVVMDRYREVDGLRFPRRLSVNRPLAGWRVQLKLGGPEFNKPIEEEAFRPGRRPGWQEIDLDRESLSNVRAFTEGR